MTSRVADAYLMLSDLCKCPFTGTIMSDPVIADDGITYERRSILTWIETSGRRVSPVSGQRISEKLLANRALRDFIEEAVKTLSEAEKHAFSAPTARIRLIVSMHWLTGMKFSEPVLPGEIPFDNNAWPLQADRSLCVKLAWKAFSALRFMVYTEFSTVVDNVPYSDPQVVSENAKKQAEYYFTDSMDEHMNETKTHQLIFALEKCVSEWRDWRKNYMLGNLIRYKENVPARWRVFWR